MDDLIRREDAINAFEPEHNCDWYTPWIVKVLEKVPSAQPKIIRCKDCKYLKEMEFYDRPGITLLCDNNRFGSITLDGFCSWAEKRGEQNG